MPLPELHLRLGGRHPSAVSLGLGGDIRGEWLGDIQLSIAIRLSASRRMDIGAVTEKLGRTVNCLSINIFAFVLF
jgi:hypothetical protein